MSYFHSFKPRRARGVSSNSSERGEVVSRNSSMLPTDGNTSKRSYSKKRSRPYNKCRILIGFLVVIFFNFALWKLVLNPNAMLSSSKPWKKFKAEGSNEIIMRRSYSDQLFQIQVMIVSKCKSFGWIPKSKKGWRLASILPSTGSGPNRNSAFLTWKKAFDASMSSLNAAAYGEDHVALRLVAACEDPKLLGRMKQYLSEVSWEAGPKSLVSEPRFRWDSPADSWSLAAASESVFMLHPGFSVAPVFYTKLKNTVLPLLQSELHELSGVDVSRHDFSAPSLRHHFSPSCQLILPPLWQNFSSTVFSPSPALPARRKKPRIVYKFNRVCGDSWQSALSSMVHAGGSFNLVVPSNICKRLSPRDKFSRDNGSAADYKVPVLKLPRYNVCGTPLPPARLATSMEELSQLLCQIHVNRTVIAVMSSAGFEGMLLNWLCFVAELDISHYVIVSDSLEQAQRMVRRGHSAYHLTIPAADGNLDYGTLGYKQFILERTRMVLSILRLEFNVLLADVDAVWLSNPFSFMTSTAYDIYAQLEPSGHLCGGFLYLRSTPVVVDTWTAVTTRYAGVVADMVREAPSIKPDNLTAWLSHYKHLHEQRYLNHYVRRNGSRVKYKGLDMLLFPNGRDYFVHQKPQIAHVEPSVIHNNYIVGKENKIRRFMETGLWRLKENNACICLNCRLKKGEARKLKPASPTPSTPPLEQ